MTKNRAFQPGWRPICMHDPSGRRGLWFLTTANSIELCSGREGDDAFVKLPYSEELEHVLEYAAYEFEKINI